MINRNRLVENIATLLSSIILNIAEAKEPEERAAIARDAATRLADIRDTIPLKEGHKPEEDAYRADLRQIPCWQGGLPLLLVFAGNLEIEVLAGNARRVYSCCSLLINVLTRIADLSEKEA